jgi:hypothetical protein
MKRIDETGWFESAFLLGLLGLGYFLCQGLVHPFLHPVLDQTLYMELAESLLNGTGFSVMHEGQPVIDAVHPPLYSLILSWVAGFSGKTHLSQWILPFKTLNMGFYLLSILLVYVFSNRNIRKPYGYLITLFYTLCPLTLSAATSIHPTLLFLNLILLALLAIDKGFVDKGEGLTRFQLTFSCFWIVLALLTKNAGYALFLAFIPLCNHCLGFRTTLTTVLVILGLISPWMLREMYFRNVEHAPVFQTVSGVQKSLDPFENGHTLGMHAVYENALSFSQDLSQALLGGSQIDPSDIQHTVQEKLPVDIMMDSMGDTRWVTWGIMGLLFFGLVFAARANTSIGGLFLASFVGMVLFFPVEKPPYYLLPILPLVVFYLFMGLMRFGDWLAQVKIPLNTVSIPALSCVFLISSVMGILSMGKLQEQMSGYFKESGYLSAMKWIRKNTPSDAAFLSNRPGTTYVYTERATSALRPASALKRNRDIALNHLLTKDYIVAEEKSPWVRKTLQPLLEAHPEYFRLVFQEEGSLVNIWRVIKP